MCPSDSRLPDHFISSPQSLSERELLDMAHAQKMDFYSELTERRVTLIVAQLANLWCRIDSISQSVAAKRTRQSLPTSVPLDLAIWDIGSDGA